MAHHRMSLKNEDDECTAQRPELSVWYDPSDPDSDCVAVSIGAAWGATQRFLALTPDEARAFARLIVKVAQEADAHEIAQLADPS